MHHNVPSTGIKGLFENWRNDFMASISVAMVAMPLGLGVAVASGAPPIAGVISAIIGGIVATLFRGSHLAINGPAAGLITVILASIVALDDGTGNTYSYVLAAIVVAGFIQILLGLFKLGKFAEILPSTVIQGIMVAIGVIIFSSQLDEALGTVPAANTIEQLKNIPNSLMNLNPFVAIISGLGILLLIFHSKISYKLFHFLPAPVWVLVFSIPFVYLFNFFEHGTLAFLGKNYEVGPNLLINIPTQLKEAIIFPNFDKIGTVGFWVSVFSISIIASIQTLAMAKAVDKLDPYRRKTDMNKDLIGIGLATMVSGAIGGLPIITVIVRSSVNIHNNAKTKWSNFFHGILMIIFIVLLAPVIQKVPMAALAAILVFTGFKLAAPKVFKATMEKGMEQLLFLLATMIITLYSNLLWGILGGIVITLIVHLLLSRVPPLAFFQLIFNSKTNIFEKKDGSYVMKLHGIANFLSVIKISKLLRTVPQGKDLNIDCSKARLVDLTVLENLESFKESHSSTGGSVSITGLEAHVASTDHRLALKSLMKSMPAKLTPRQNRLQNMAELHNWEFRPEVDLDTTYLRNFQFFETRPIERKNNSIKGSYPNSDATWEISDITFDEGAMLASEVYKTTVQVIQLPFEVPVFVLEKEGYFDKIFDRILALTGTKDIDLSLFTGFSSHFLLKGESEEEIKLFFTKDLIKFLEKEDIHHIESNGEALLIFNYLRQARTDETNEMLSFSEELVEKLALNILLEQNLLA